MFENLQSRFAAIFGKLRSGKRVDERAVKEAVREVRLAFLEADVNYQATREFCRQIEEKALGVQVLAGLNPAQQVIKIVYDTMVEMLGGEKQKLALMPGQQERIMLVGLQGSGKTTTAAKLAARLRHDGRKPILIAGDIHRPAAIKQLEVVGRQVGVPVFSMGTDVDPATIAKEGTEKAKADDLDTIILDTAGRLHIDEQMMAEVKRVRESWHPTLTLLVVDAMVGQDAVNQARHFHENLDLDGTILTKLDGDTRGGAAISVRYVTRKPIYFAGTGEKLSDFEFFYPDRMASRILGMGDVLTLIEKAQQAVDQDEALALQKKILENTFTLDDFLSQIRNVRKMGGLGSLMSLLPGMGSSNMMEELDMEEEDMKHVEAIVLSMTPSERTDHRLINGSRKRRIARGSGTSMQDVNRLLKQFVQMQQMMRAVASQGMAAGAKAAKKKLKMSKKIMKKMQGMRGMFPGF
jgi:signal recognition particle subunit SRP54